MSLKYEPSSEPLHISFSQLLAATETQFSQFWSSELGTYKTVKARKRQPRPESKAYLEDLLDFGVLHGVGDRLGVALAREHHRLHLRRLGV